MNWNDVGKYLVPAIINLYGEDRAVYAENLDKALGVKWYHQLCTVGSDNVPLNKEAVGLYRKLAGPNGRTILRIYQIKHDLPISDLDKEVEKFKHV